MLLDQRVLRLRENPVERKLVKIRKGGQHGEPPDDLGDEAVLQQILRRNLAEDFAGAAVIGRDDLGAEADRARQAARRDDLPEPGEGDATYEKNIGGVDLQEFLLRVLAPTLRWHRSDSSFHDLQQRLLNALSRNVAADRDVLGPAADLVDLVDIDNAALRALDIVFGRLQQLEDDVLDVLPDIAGFRQSRGIRYREWHVKDTRERLREQRLARPGRANQQDVRLRELNVAFLSLVIEAFVVIVNC